MGNSKLYLSFAIIIICLVVSITTQSLIQNEEKLVEIVCLLNCGPNVYPTKQPQLQVNCFKNCENLAYTWKVRSTEIKTVSISAPNIFDMPVPDDMGTVSDIRINPRPTTVNLNTSNGGTASHTTTYSEYDVYFVTKCEKNCDYEPDKKVELFSRCFYDTLVMKRQCNVYFNYKLEPPGEYTASGIMRSTLTIHADQYQAGEEVEVTVIPTRGVGEGKTVIMYKPEEKEHGCVIDPTSGISGETLFTISCHHPDGMVFAVYNDNVLIKHSQSHIIGDLWLTKGTPSKIKIIVLKNGKEIAEYNLEAMVEELPPEEGNVENAVNERILSYDDLEAFDQLIRHEQYNKIVQLASLLLDTINPKDYTHLRKHILAKVNKVIDKLDPLQIVTLLRKELNKQPITESFAFEMAANSFRECTTRFLDTKMYPRNEIPDHAIQNFTQTSLEIASKLLTVDESVRNAMSPTIISPDYALYADLEPRRAYAKWHHGLGTIGLVDGIHSLTALAYSHAHILTLIDTPNIKFQADYLPIYKPNIVKAKIDAPEGASFVEIDFSLINELLSFPHNIAYATASFEINPFWWHEIDSTFVSKVIMLTLHSGDERIRKVDAPIDVFMQINESVFGQVSVNLHRSVVAYTVNVKQNSLLILILHGANSSYFVHVSPHHPTEHEIKTKGVKIDPGTTLRYQYGVGSFDVICVSFIGDSEIVYDIGMYSCMSWDGSSWEWDNDCLTMEDAQPKLMHCKCRHLSLFAISFIVPPNRIILPSIPLHIALAQNPLILVTLIVFTIIYISLLIYAHKKDKVLNLRRKTLPLEDIVPGDGCKYVIIIRTGIGLNAGTTSDVIIELIGTKATSRRHLLQTSARPLLQRGYEDWLVIFTPYHLGDINYVRLFHNNCGTNPHWFCELVIVKDLNVTNDYYFIIRNWFSVIYGDGKLDRTIPATQFNNLKRKHKNVPLAVVDKLKNDHLWLSVFSRSSHSGFSCKERVTAAYCVLLISMLTSAMFFGLPGTTDDGSYQFALRELAITVESLLISVPISVGLVLLFKKSRPKWTKPNIK